MNSETVVEDDDGGIFLSSKQRIFVRFTIAILVDLALLNFFEEYWQYVSFDSFTISFFAAIILQFLLYGTLQFEHWVAGYFKKIPGTKAKVYRGVCTYLILVLSKFVMLGVIDFIFGDSVQFTGPFHGVVAFIVVVVVIVVAEQVFAKIYRMLE